MTILGGQCAENALQKFLGQWDLAEMPFRVWEYVSEVVFEKETLPKNVVLLERGRVFGKGGDLMLWRNGPAFGWRFVGPAGAKCPGGEYGVKNYWDFYPQVTFHVCEKAALLWGEQETEKDWIEDRVKSAKLSYPAEGKRVQLDYKIFTHADQVKFVWYFDLREWKEAEHDGRYD